MIFEDNDLMVVEKPVGWVVNDSATAHALPTIQKWVEANFDWPLAHNTLFRNGVVHRLDKDTSGLLILAKNEVAFLALQKAFKERRVEKQYLALVHGKVKTLLGEIDQPIMRNPGNRRKFGVFFGGRPSLTRYEVLKTYEHSGRSFALIACYPKTGRTHQIRVHMRYLGHSLVGDPVYTERKMVKVDRLLTDRIFLHAAKISFTHPTTKQQVSFESPLPEELEMVLTKLE